MPSPSDIRHIQDLIADGEARLITLERAKAQLDAQSDMVRADILSWKQVLCPMRRLPLELLSEIFLHVLGCHDSDDQELMDSLSSICQVSSFWRRLAIRTPRLWTKVFLSIPARQPLTDDFFTMVEDHLSRSAPHGISLHFGTPASLQRPPERIDGLLQTLIPFLSRLRSLKLHLPDKAFLAFHGFPDKTDDLLALQSLDIQFSMASITTRELNTSLPPMRLNAPHLQDIRFQDCGNHYTRSIFCQWPIPWSQIVTLHASELFETAETAREALVQCSSLELCSLECVNLWDLDG